MIPTDEHIVQKCSKHAQPESTFGLTEWSMAGLSYPHHQYLQYIVTFAPQKIANLSYKPWLLTIGP